MDNHGKIPGSPAGIFSPKSTRSESVRTIIVLIAVAVVVMTSPLMAGTYMRQAMHTDPFEVAGMKQAAVDDTSEIWLDKTQACMISKQATVILHADKGTLFIVDHTSKSYMEMPVGALQEMMKQGDDSAAAMAEGMMAGMKLTVTPTDEKKTVGKWNASKYIMEMTMPMGSGKTEIWATEELKVDYAMFYAVSNAMLAMMPGFGKIMKELEKIKGVGVLTVTESNAMGAVIKQTTQLVECTEKTPPDGIFSIPADYKKSEMMGAPPTEGE